MRSINRHFIFYLIIFAALLGVKSAFAEEILKDVVVSAKGDIVEVKAKMSMPFKYVKHFPSRRGKIIQIQIKAADDNVDPKAIKRRDTIKSPSNDFLKIRDVIYEGNVRGGPYLVLRFPEVVGFSIKPMTVSEEITILVKTEKPIVQPEAPIVKEEPSSELEKLMREARIALTNGKNSEAILIFNDILKSDNPKYMPDAKEYLGLARERSGQLEMAKKEYEEYLKLYPKNRRAKTVQQRLMTLNARLARPKRDLKESKRLARQTQEDRFKRTDVFGRVSSIYYSAFMEKEKAEVSGYENQQSLLMNFFDVTRRQRDKDKEIRYAFSGSHETDFTTRKYHMEPRVRSFLIDYKNKVNGLEVSVGRQSASSGGVLGRFDGGLVGFRIKPKINAFLVGGFPVDFLNHQTIQTTKPMFGARLDFDELKKGWKGSIYGINQNVDGIVNRRAVGADARYFQNKKIFYSLVDYDIYFSELNFLTFHYGWQINDKTKLDFHFDKRRSPVMLSSNALLGLSSVESANALGNNVNQSNLDEIKRSTSVKELLNYGMTAEDIRKRVDAVTGESMLITSGIRRVLMKDLDFNATLTLSQYKPGEELDPDKDDEPPEDTSFLPSVDEFDYALNLQLIKRNFFKERDILLGGARVTNNKNSRRYETNINLRFPVRKNIWINPKFRVMYTTNKQKQKKSGRLSPKFRAEYKHNKKLSFDGEVGLDINQSEIEGEDYKWLSVNAGFRYIF